MRTTRALRERTGYSEPVVDFALDALFGSLTADALTDVISAELGSLAAFERFVARSGRPEVRYAGVAEAAIVSSDTTVGVAIPALAFALCAGAHVVVKDRNDRLVAAFAATLAEELPELGRRLEATTWSGVDEAASRAALATADTIVAYGRTQTLGAIRALLRPDARFVANGPRTSVGYVARETLARPGNARAAALGAARDALLYDGEGCLSLHVLFVERDGALAPAAFARLAADACEETATEFPAGYAQLDAAAAAYARAALFRAAQGSGAVSSGLVAPHLVVLDPPLADPPPLLRRTLAIYAVSAPDEALVFLRRHALPLEAVAFGDDAPRPELEAFALACGAARITTLGELQRPPLQGDHGGSGRILPFVRAIYRG